VVFVLPASRSDFQCRQQFPPFDFTPGSIGNEGTAPPLADEGINGSDETFGDHNVGPFARHLPHPLWDFHVNTLCDIWQPRGREEEEED
jgi:hypothetical protein